MVTLTRLRLAHPGLRPMNPFRDWGGVAQLMRVAFQSEASPSTLPFFPDWPLWKWVSPLAGLVEWLGVETPEQMLGYVWEEAGQIVGNVTLGLSDARAGAWLLSNVAVHPAYRRRGIARALVDASIQMVRHYSGRYLLLQVQSDNWGARHLYEVTGFRTLEQTSEFYGANVAMAAPHPIPTAGGFTLAPPERAQWMAVRALAAAHLPAELQAYRHSLAGLFNVPHQPGWPARVMDLSASVQRLNWCLLRGQTVCGGMAARAQLGWGTHRVGVYVAPAYRGPAEDLLTAQAVQQLRRYASQRAQFVIPAGCAELADSLRRYGFQETRRLDLMALDLS